MDLPKISIMIPTYNRASMLAEAIESCLAQDYLNLEVVISDNASTDQTTSVLQRYLRDPRVRYFRNEINIGAGANWHRLLYEYAQGEYGQLLADDDLLADKQYLSKVADLIAETGVKAIFSGFLYVDIVSGKRGVRDPRMPPVVTPAMWVEVLGTFRDGNYIFPCLPTVYHLAQARALNVYYPAIPGLDFELGLRFMLAGPTGYLEGTYCIARGHSGNLSRTQDTSEGFLEGAKMFQRFYEQGLALGLSEPKLMAAKKRLMVLYLRTFMLRAWLEAGGNSLRALYAFYRKVANLDPVVGRQVFLDLRTIGKIVLYNHRRAYQAVDRLINRRDYQSTGSLVGKSSK